MRASPLAIDFTAIGAEGSQQTDGSSAAVQVFTPLGAPILSQPAPDLQQLGLNLLRPPAPTWTPDSQLELSGSQQTLAQGETLEQILRSIATVHPQVEPRVSPLDVRAQQGDESQRNSKGGQAQGFSELFLQSETAGAALRAVVDLRTLDEHGVTFSVLGMGNFELSAVSGTHDVMLSALSNGWSATFSGAADPNGVRYASNPTGDGANPSPRPRPNLLSLMVSWLVDFLGSPVGILLTILSGLVLMVWIAISALRVVRGTPSRHRRFRRARPSQVPATSSRQRGERHIAASRLRRSRRRFGRRAPQA